MPLQMGADPTLAGESFAGLIDDVYLYNSVLTESEIQGIMFDSPFSETPVGAILEAGGSHTFHAALRFPVGAVSYQWMKDGSPVGPNSGDYVIADLLESDTGTYHCEITDESLKAVFVTESVFLEVLAPGSLPATRTIALALICGLLLAAGTIVILKKRLA